MMKQRIKKQFWFSPQEAKELKRKAKLCGITETAVIRILLRAAKANALGFIDTPMLKNEALRWHKLQAAIEREYLRPEKSNLKWQ